MFILIYYDFVKRKSFDGEVSSPERVEVVEISPPLGVTPSVWQPRAMRMKEFSEQCDYPNYFGLKAPHLNSNVRMGEVLDYGEIFFWSYHL